MWALDEKDADFIVHLTSVRQMVESQREDMANGESGVRDRCLTTAVS